MAGLITNESATTSREGGVRALATEKALTRGHNRPLIDGQWPARPTEYNIYIYTVSKLEFSTRNTRAIHHALFPLVEIFPPRPTDPENGRYRLVRYIPHPVPEKVEDVFGTGRDPYNYWDAARIAQDLINPSNPTLNQDIDEYGEMDPYFNVQTGTNLARHGLFWSRNNPPAEEEIKRAENKRDRYYAWLIAEADRMFASNPASARTLIQEDHRIALEFFGEERPWFQKPRPKKDCPNCSEKIPATAAFHFLPNGKACVNNWDRAIQAGAVTEEQRPGFKRGPGRPRKEDAPEEQ